MYVACAPRKQADDRSLADPQPTTGLCDLDHASLRALVSHLASARDLVALQLACRGLRRLLLEDDAMWVPFLDNAYGLSIAVRMH
jgi:hypothetical protein